MSIYCLSVEYASFSIWTTSIGEFVCFGKDGMMLILSWFLRIRTWSAFVVVVVSGSGDGDLFPSKTKQAIHLHHSYDSRAISKCTSHLLDNFLSSTSVHFHFLFLFYFIFCFFFKTSLLEYNCFKTVC